MGFLPITDTFILVLLSGMTIGDRLTRQCAATLTQWRDDERLPVVRISCAFRAHFVRAWQHPRILRKKHAAREAAFLRCIPRKSHWQKERVRQKIRVAQRHADVGTIKAHGALTRRPPVDHHARARAWFCRQAGARLVVRGGRVAGRILVDLHDGVALFQQVAFEDGA